MWAVNAQMMNGLMETTSKSRCGQSHIFRIGSEIHFTDDVTYESMHDLIKTLKEAEQEACDNVAACKKKLVLSDLESKTVELSLSPKPIKLYLTTHGGSVYAALRTVDIIKSLSVPVHTIVSGYVASAGTLLSMAGKKRYITPNSFMLVHELRSSFWGKHSDAREQLENLDKLMDTITKFIKQNSKIPEATLKDILAHDKNWSAEECLHNGIADELYGVTD
jgi:ATP-dependent protease ClpP protease subunit